jgi:hypothetical protein
VKILALPILVLAALAVLAGCGGSSPGAASAGRAVDGITVAGCLNDREHFLVQSSQSALEGQSPAGVSFTLTLYKTNAAAAAAFAGKSPKTAARVENGVLDVQGNPPLSPGGPPARLSKSELDAVKRCIDSTRAAGK